MMSVKFHFKDTSIGLNKRLPLKSFIANIFKKEGCHLKSLEFIFCTDEYLLDINRSFLNHNNYTDIITFNLADTNNPVVGEIYISVDRVKENALKFKVTASQELHRVIFHGALHLCGYKDKTKDEQKLMSAMEDKYLSLYTDTA